MGWNKGIILAFVLFAALLAAMVVFTMKQDLHLVEQNYYEQELTYQQRIDQKRNFKALLQKPEMNLVDNNKVLKIVFPEALARQIQSGEVSLYRPSDALQDQSIPLELDSNGLLSISVSELSKGLWKIKLEWNDSSKAYYNESNIFL